MLTDMFEFLLPYFQSNDFFFSVSHHFLPELLISFVLVDVRLWQFCINSILSLLNDNLLFGLLAVDGLGNSFALLYVLGHFLCVFFDKIIFIPDALSLEVSLLGIHVFLVLSFYSIFSFLLMYLDVVFYSLHNNLLIEVVFSLSQRLIRIMLQLYALTDAVHLKRFDSIVDIVYLFLPKRLIKLRLLLLQESFQGVVFFNTHLFYLLSLHPYVINLSLVLSSKLMICPYFA